MRRALLVCCGAVVLLALTLAPIDAASPSVRLDAVPTTASTLAVKGTVTSRAASATASLQAKLSSGWSTLATTRVSPTGRVSFSTVPTTGRTAYRVQVAKTRRTATLTSRTFTVTGTPRITPDLPVLAERTTVGGRVPSTGARDVVLQERTSTGWVEVARARAGSTGLFTVPFVAESARFRVQAPQLRSGRVVKPTWTSSEIALAPPRQTGTLQSLRPAVVGERATFRATFSPACPGRAVQLREQRGDAWVVVATGHQATSGRADLGFVPSRPATLQLRATSSGDDVTVHGTPPLAVQVDTASPPIGARFPDAEAPVERLGVIGTDLSPAATVAASVDGRYHLLQGYEKVTDPMPPRFDGTQSRTYLYDRVDGTTRMIGASADGNPPRFGTTFPTMSDDGRWVAFQATMDLLDDSGDRARAVMLWDRRDGSVRRITRSDSYQPQISADGSHVVYLADIQGEDADHPTVHRWSRATGVEEVVSKRPDGDLLSSGWRPQISGDGRHVLYQRTFASREEGADRMLVLWDGTDRSTRIVTRDGAGHTYPGTDFTMSRDARFVSFSSHGEGLSQVPSVPGKLTSGPDFYLWDGADGSIEQVTDDVLPDPEVRSNGASRVTADGRYVYFTTSHSSAFALPAGRGPQQVVRWDRLTDEKVLVSKNARGEVGDGRSWLIHPGEDGRGIILGSAATNLVEDDASGRADQVVVTLDWTPDRGRGAGYADIRPSTPTTWSFQPRPRSGLAYTLVSKARDGGPASQGAGGVSMSHDGRFVAFGSSSLDLGPDEGPTSAWPNYGASDIFLWDRQTETVERVSVGMGGAPTDHQSYGAVISADGRWVAYVSEASNLVPGDRKGGVNSDIFLWDRLTGTTRIVTNLPSPDTDDGNSPLRLSMSPDGNHLAFWSDVSLVAGERLPPITERLYTWDRRTGELEWLRLPSTSNPPRTDPGSSYADNSVAIANGGRKVVFTRDQEAMERTGRRTFDVYLWDVGSGSVSIVSRNASGDLAAGASDTPSISADGRYVGFTSQAPDLVADDTNGLADAFVHDTVLGRTTMISRPRPGGSDVGMSGAPRFSADSATVIFSSHAALDPSDDNRVMDAYVWSRASGQVTLVSRSALGGGSWGGGDVGSASAAISGDGRTMVFGNGNGEFGLPAATVRSQLLLTSVPAVPSAR